MALSVTTAKFTLNDGAHIPAIGLGGYQVMAGEQAYSAVLNALRSGYRHIDTATLYENEADVGRAVRDSGVPREEVFVTTKFWTDPDPDVDGPSSSHGYEKARSALADSLQRLGLSYVDLYLIHSPLGGTAAEWTGSWRAFEDAKAAGLARSIGVANFGVHHLAELLKTARIPPAVNQLEVHPFLQRRELCRFCAEKGILVEAYSPLTKGRKLADPRLAAVAARYGVTPAQALLRWCYQKGYVALPKSVRAERQRENADIFRFALGLEDLAALDACEEGLVTSWDPTNSPL